MPPYSHIVIETYPHGNGSWEYGFYSQTAAEIAIIEMQSAHPYRTYTLEQR